jgi:hypothetical protein
VVETRLTLHGETVHFADTDVYVVTYPFPVSQAGAAAIRRAWQEHMGGKKIIVLDRGAVVTRITPPEPTPIYDALLAEVGYERVAFAGMHRAARAGQTVIQSDAQTDR